MKAVEGGERVLRRGPLTLGVNIGMDLGRSTEAGVAEADGFLGSSDFTQKKVMPANCPSTVKWTVYRPTSLGRIPCPNSGWIRSRPSVISTRKNW